MISAHYVNSMSYLWFNLSGAKTGHRATDDDAVKLAVLCELALHKHIAAFADHVIITNFKHNVLMSLESLKISNNNKHNNSCRVTTAIFTVNICQKLNLLIGSFS